MATEETSLKSKKDPSISLFARIRKHDDLLHEHFSKIKQEDRVHEMRRLLEIAILSKHADKRN